MNFNTIGILSVKTKFYSLPRARFVSLDTSAVGVSERKIALSYYKIIVFWAALQRWQPNKT